MTDQPPFVDRFDDPRITPQFCRSLPSRNLVLLGVVHDHPASIGRVERVLEAVEPNTLALELPPAAISLYQRAGGVDGGEMTAALEAAPTATAVGIDGPDWSFLRRVLTTLLADRVSLSTARRVLASVSGATKTALACRVATVSNATETAGSIRADPIQYDCSSEDTAARQADHERRHVDSVRTLLALEQMGTEDSSLPTAATYRDEAREACMIDRLESLTNGTGLTVAIVGVDHLDALETALRRAEPSRTIH